MKTNARGAGGKSLAVLLLIAGGLLLVGPACAKETSGAPFPRRLEAKAFPEGLPWINTVQPITLGQLRGKFVLLDFWTLGCINCMHIIPELRKLEEAWPDDLVVVGVHSAKFDREKTTESIREAVLRYRVEHPVVNDSDFVLWNAYGIRAWPSLVLIDPEGYAVWGHSGEITFAQLDALLRKAAPYYRKRGSLDGKPIRFEPESTKLAKTPLRFPGKVLADEASGRLFIADSGHNQIVVASLDGMRRATIGTGTVGRADGDYATAEFNAPQGMALDGQTLYVADTENHLIRRIDLEKQRVATVVGTGRQNRLVPRLGPLGKPLATALSSPWDLWIHDGNLYVAMAGTHQLWRMKLDGSAISVFAGNGAEDIVDGAIRGHAGLASFAQPSGLASDEQWLFVADSEGSSIRAVPFDPRRDVRTVVGTAWLPSARLFTFGDVDGRGEAVRLQHPLGLVFWEGRLYVADTYNNKVKVVEPADGEVRTFAGDGKPGRTDDPARFDQPGGISAAGGKLFVADTNNHQIRVIDLHENARVTTLSVGGR